MSRNMETSGSNRRVRYLIVGGGASGLGFANFVGNQDYLILERDSELGGYCRTIRQDGFVWDYSGHFLHLRDTGIRDFFAARTDPAQLFPVRKTTHVHFGGRLIDYPFQRNVHQLPSGQYLRCLASLLTAKRNLHPRNLAENLEGQVGREITRIFLRPYNEKLHQCALQDLAPDALGRFFPAMTAWDAVRNAFQADNRSYNDAFMHPRTGISYYIQGLLRDLDPARIRTGEALVRVDLARREATTSRGNTIAYEYLISSAPLPQTLAACGVAVPEGVFSHSKVLVLNLGFDRPGRIASHWIYFPEAKYVFYRVGSYDHLFSTDRLSLYVECAFKPGDVVDVPAVKARVLEQLREAEIVTDQQLVSWHAVVMDPAYVHIRSEAEVLKPTLMAKLKAGGVHPIGRYGSWIYCSIEDNLIQARALAAELGSVTGSGLRPEGT